MSDPDVIETNGEINLPQGNSRINPVETAIPYKSPEAKVAGLLPHVKKAELVSFQEYGYIATRSGNRFITEKNKLSGQTTPDDIINTDKYRETLHSRATGITQVLQDTFGYPQLGLNQIRSEGDLLCVIGKNGSDTVIQGGGNLHFDGGGRLNTSSFKLVFDEGESASEFVDWIQSDPNEALGSTFRRVIGTYTEEGEFQGTLLPEEKVRTRGHQETDPFGVPIKAVKIKDLDTGEKIERNLEDSDVYKRSKEEWDALRVAAMKIFEQRELSLRAKSRIDSSGEVPGSPSNPNLEKPQSLDNPSGGDPNAPLTKLINLAIRSLSRKK